MVWCRRGSGWSSSPPTPVSLYASYSVSYLPRAGEQLSSLSLTNQALEPEEFRNYEVGAKWDLTGALSLSAARLSAGSRQRRRAGSERSDGVAARGRAAHEGARARAERAGDAGVERHRRHTRIRTAKSRARCPPRRSRARALAQLPAHIVLDLESLRRDAQDRRGRSASSIAATCSRPPTTP